MTDLPEDDLPPELSPFAERAADEGVPVRAIARIFKKPAEGVREAISAGILSGRIVYMPRDDWPIGENRLERAPCYTRASRVNDETLVHGCIRLFKVTKLQASLLAVLLTRNEVSKETMHQIIEDRRGPHRDETAVKMVDVVICNLRKRLKPFGFKIITIWSCGYFMTQATRRDILEMVNSNGSQVQAASVSSPQGTTGPGYTGPGHTSESPT